MKRIVAIVFLITTQYSIGQILFSKDGLILSVEITPIGSQNCSDSQSGTLYRMHYGLQNSNNYDINISWWVGEVGAPMGSPCFAIVPNGISGGCKDIIQAGETNFADAYSLLTNGIPEPYWQINWYNPIKNNNPASPNSSTNSPGGQGNSQNHNLDLNLSNDVVTYTPQQQQAQQQQAQYNSLISQGNSAYSNKNYSLALQYYQQAYAIASDDPILKARIQEIETIKKEEANQTQIKNESRDLISQADQNMKDGNYLLAEEQYTQAIGKDPNNSYAKSQQQKAQFLQADKEKKAAELKRMEELKVQQEAAAVQEKHREEVLKEHNNAYKQNYEYNKKQQEETAKRTKEALVTGGAAFAGLVAAGISSNNKASYYRGHGLHLGLNLGLAGGSAPFATRYTEYSFNDYGTYKSVIKNDSSVVSKSPFGTGITGGVDFDPLLSEYLSMGGFLYGTAGFSPSMISGGSSSSTPDGNGSLQISSSFLYNTVNYGLNFTLGSKIVKGLFELSENRCHYSYTNVEMFSNRNANYTYYDNKVYDFTVNYLQIKKGVGARFMSYKTQWSIDLIYYFYTPVDQQRKWALSLPQHLFKARIWKQSIFKFDATVGFNNTALSNDIKYNQRKNMSGLYASFGIVYCKDFFSKSYFKPKQ